MSNDAATCPGSTNASGRVERQNTQIIGFQALCKIKGNSAPNPAFGL
jgi:hypothetical protein